MTSEPTSIVVIGGGITGLVAARTLSAEAPGTRVVLLEAADRLGGMIRTVSLGGGLLDTGPDWIVTKRPEGMGLIRALGLERDAVAPAVAGAKLWIGGELRSPPEGSVMGMPPSLRSLRRSGLVSTAGLLRAAADRILPGPLSGPDVSVGSYVGRRLGREVLEKLVDPMIAASRSGDVDSISLTLASPEVDAAARSRRSLMGAVSSLSSAGAPGFVGLRGGMERLIEALVRDLQRGVELRKGVEVAAVEALDERYRVRLRSNETLEADAVVVAVPPHAAAGLLADLSPRASALLGRISFAPAIVLGFTYPGAPAPPPATSGFIVPRAEGKLLTAGAWFSSKWPHAGPPGGGSVIRAFAGRRDEDLPDDEFLERAEKELGEAMGLTGRPRERTLVRWGRALPRFEVGHARLVEDIEGALAGHPRVALAGAGYRGSGIPDCIAGGTIAARSVLSDDKTGARG